MTAHLVSHHTRRPIHVEDAAETSDLGSLLADLNSQAKRGQLWERVAEQKPVTPHTVATLAAELHTTPAALIDVCLPVFENHPDLDPAWDGHSPDSGISPDEPVDEFDVNRIREFYAEFMEAVEYERCRADHPAGKQRTTN